MSRTAPATEKYWKQPCQSLPPAQSASRGIAGKSSIEESESKKSNRRNPASALEQPLGYTANVPRLRAAQRATYLRMIGTAIGLVAVCIWGATDLLVGAVLFAVLFTGDDVGIFVISLMRAL